MLMDKMSTTGGSNDGSYMSGNDTKLESFAFRSSAFGSGYMGAKSKLDD